MKLLVFTAVIFLHQQVAQANAANIAGQLAVTRYLFVDHPKAQGLNPIKIDGCSSSPEGWWRQCCIEHDVNYWIGGDSKDRLYADYRLYNCMNKLKAPAGLYYNSVRSFGAASWNIAWGLGGRYARLTRVQCETLKVVLDRWSGHQFFEWVSNLYRRTDGGWPQHASIKTVSACRHHGGI